MTYFLHFLLSGLYIGTIYSIIALGMVIIYKSTKVFNFAQGHLLMVGVLLTATIGSKFGVIGGLVIGFLGTAFLGFLLERLTLRPLIGQPLIAALLMTIAIGYLLEGGAIMAWGEGLYKYIELFPAKAVLLGKFPVRQEILWAFIVVIVSFSLFGLFYRKTLLGKAMRATAEDHQVSQSLGIRVTRIFSISWVVSGMMAFIASVFLGNLSGGHYLNYALGLKAIPAVLVGGLDSIVGAIIGGLIVGVIESLVTGYLTAELGEVIPFIILLLVLLVKPYGLFGLVRIERV
jgi:branched-chain amino acid transport system permease protein